MIGSHCYTCLSVEMGSLELFAWSGLKPWSSGSLLLKWLGL
jgi:hypothetical protein